MSIKNINNFFSNINIDNIRDFVEKYIMQIIYFACFISLIIFFSIFLINRKEKKLQNLMVEYYQANNYIKNENIKEGLGLLQNIYSSKYTDKNLKTISGIRLAELLIAENKEMEAYKIYNDIYNLKNNDNFLKNLSGLAALNILINQNNSNDYNKIEKFLLELKTKNNPLLNLVEEQEGMFEIQRGNKEKGLKILKEILLKTNLDEDTKSRIELVIGLYKNENI